MQEALAGLEVPIDKPLLPSPAADSPPGVAVPCSPYYVPPTVLKKLQGAGVNPDTVMDGWTAHDV